MKRTELIPKFIEFFKSKGHKVIANASLIPENDPTVLFTTAGMHPLVPYLSGQKHPQGKKLVGIQKCIRTGDIEEVGDTVHHTFFEMLGNWSLGDYEKTEAIRLSSEFLTQTLKLDPNRIAVSVFAGDDSAPKDIESAKAWENLGIPRSKIAFLGKEDNWWGPAGKTGPCGPDTEMFYWKLNDKPAPESFDTNNENWVEIWNDVIMQYIKDENGNYVEAKQKNIDTGMGVERTIAVLNGLEDNYEAEMWKPIIEKIEELSNKKYNFTKGDLGFDEEPDCWREDKKAMRIIADHIKAAVFIINDGIEPSNTEQGYVLRRLIRRAITKGKKLGIENFVSKVANSVYPTYPDYNLDSKIINLVLSTEEDRFLKTIDQGIRIFGKLATNKKKIDGKNAFLLFQSYGFPIEMTTELAEEKNIEVDIEGYKQALSKHQELSRTATTGKFKSGLADHGKETTKLHTVAHLVHQALRNVLNEPVEQKGSNINAERLRFDFSFHRKLTDEEVKAVEILVNEKIKKEIPVTMKEMTVDEAKNYGAIGIFDDKYGDKVKVYTIADFSKEICSGPHVKNTKELGKFKIAKQKSVGSGVRRIKAVLE